MADAGLIHVEHQLPRAARGGLALYCHSDNRNSFIAVFQEITITIARLHYGLTIVVQMHAQPGSRLLLSPPTVLCYRHASAGHYIHTQYPCSTGLSFAQRNITGVHISTSSEFPYLVSAFLTNLFPPKARIKC